VTVAVARAAIETGVTQMTLDSEEVSVNAAMRIKDGK